MAQRDSLKSAVEKFIVDFPEFEDLDLEDLYKEMEKKGYFGDERKYDKKAKGGMVDKKSKPTKKTKKAGRLAMRGYGIARK